VPLHSEPTGVGALGGQEYPPTPPLPRPSPPGLRGTISDAHIDNCAAANALTNGATKSRQMSLILVSYGGWWTIDLAVDVYLRALPSTLKRSTSFLLIKLPGFEPLPAMRHHRRLVVFDLARLSVASHR